MAEIETLRKQWTRGYQREINNKKQDFVDSIKIMIVWLILAGLNVWWLCSTDKTVHIEEAKAFGFTIAEAHDRINGTYIFVWIVMTVIGLITLNKIIKCFDKKELLNQARSTSLSSYVAKQEAEFRKLNIECPNCRKFFDRDKDDFNRYVVGSAKNTAKFIGELALKEGAKIIGGMLTGGNEYATTMSGRAGGELAKEMGLRNYDGWKHKCPYCKHKW